MITQLEYQQRRRYLGRQLPENAIAIIPGACEVQRSGDTYYRFRQDSDFYYLTGFNEPQAILIVTGKNGESTLFNRPKNPDQEQWTGKRLGQEAACEALGLEGAYPIESFDSRLLDFLVEKTMVYYAIGCHSFYEKKILRALKELKAQRKHRSQAPEIRDLDPILSEMRLLKSESEIYLMRKAASLSVAAHQRAMKACRKASNECHLEAELLYELTYGGCRSVAYDPIVGSGENACILHYTDNNQPLRSDDLVLIDAGGEFANYAADITRTFPVNGRFNKEQRAIYSLVLKAQKAGLACIKPGLPWNEIQRQIVRVLTEGLCELGLLQGEVDALITKGSYKPFYMHNSGHWLGLDVHDVGSYHMDGQWRPLQPGMVLTVEPGLYIKPGIPGVDRCWWNIGIRIEDDILVTNEGYENLTAALPVEMDEIEALMA